MKSLNCTLLGLLLVLLLGAVGCIRGIAEDSVRKSLRKIIGPAEKYEVTIEHTSDGRLMAGDIEDLTVVGHRVRTKDGLVIEKLTVKMHKLKVDTGQKRIKSVESATFDLDVQQEALSALARQRVRGVARPVVLLGTNTVSVVLPAKLLNASVDTTLRGMLAVDASQRIMFIPDRLTIGPLPVPLLLVTAAVGQINPLADLRALPVPAEVDSLTTFSGVLNVKGRLYVSPGASAATPNPPGGRPWPPPAATSTPGPTPSASPSSAPSATPSPRPSSEASPSPQGTPLPERTGIPPNNPP